MLADDLRLACRTRADLRIMQAAPWRRKRMTPSQAAERYVRIHRAGEAPLKYDLSQTPYSRKVLDSCGSRRFDQVVFCASQQSGKTQPILGLMGYHAIVDPADLMLIEKNEKEARNFTNLRLDRTIECSPEWAACLTGRKKDDTVQDKTYKNGAWHSIAYPATNVIAGKPTRVNIVTDHDRTRPLIGHGSLFDLLHKRSETHGARRMTFAESSPGHLVIEDGKVDLDTGEILPLEKHEAPPCDGILGLYNRGTRERWYWPCDECRHWFIPEFECIRYDYETGMQWMDVAESARMECPMCHHRHHPARKAALNEQGVWCGPDQQILLDGRVDGPERRTTMASFWLPGPASFMQRWGAMAVTYEQAKIQYEQTGSEEELMATVLSDQAKPYTPMRRAKARTADELEERSAQESWPPGVVPPGVRFITAQVDIGKGKFDVMVCGWGVDLECWILDRWKSVNVDPSKRLEDWESVIRDQVIRRVYPVAGLKDRYMGMKVVACDSKGEEGVTDMAYAFWRQLRKARLTDRFMLISGQPAGLRLSVGKPEKSSHRQKEARRKFVEANMADVYTINSNLTKDAADKYLAREDAGGRYVHFGRHLPRYIFAELTSEIRNDKGRWEKSGSHTPNESLDLFGYGIAACWALQADKMDWQHPKPWARPWLQNSLVMRGADLPDDALLAS